MSSSAASISSLVNQQLSEKMTNLSKTINYISTLKPATEGTQQSRPSFGAVNQPGIASFHQNFASVTRQAGNRPKRQAVTNPKPRLDDTMRAKGEKIQHGNNIYVESDDDDDDDGFAIEFSDDEEEEDECDPEEFADFIDDRNSSEYEEVSTSGEEVVKPLKTIDLVDDVDADDLAILSQSKARRFFANTTEEDEEDEVSEEGEEDDEESEDDDYIDLDQDMTPGELEAEELADRVFGWEHLIIKPQPLSPDFRNLTLHHVLYVLFDLCCNDYIAEKLTTLSAQRFNPPRFSRKWVEAARHGDIDLIEDPYVMACHAWKRLFQDPLRNMYRNKHSRNNEFKNLLIFLGDNDSTCTVKKISKENASKRCIFDRSLPADYEVDLQRSFFVSAKYVGYLELLLHVSYIHQYAEKFFEIIDTNSAKEKVFTDEGKAELCRCHVPLLAHDAMGHFSKHFVRNQFIALPNTLLINLLR